MDAPNILESVRNFAASKGYTHDVEQLVSAVQADAHFAGKTADDFVTIIGAAIQRHVGEQKAEPLTVDGVKQYFDSLVKKGASEAIVDGTKMFDAQFKQSALAKQGTDNNIKKLLANVPEHRETSIAKLWKGADQGAKAEAGILTFLGVSAFTVALRSAGDVYKADEGQGDEKHLHWSPLAVAIVQTGLATACIWLAHGALSSGQARA